MSSLVFVKFFFIDLDEGYLMFCKFLFFYYVIDVMGLFIWIFLWDIIGCVYVYFMYDNNVLMF